MALSHLPASLANAFGNLASWLDYPSAPGKTKEFPLHCESGVAID
jgi:hypothetical protein